MNLPNPQQQTNFSVLRCTIFLDGLLHVMFGLFSLIFPHQTFGTIIDIAAANASAGMMPVLANMSLFYVLVGLLCLCISSLPDLLRRRFVVPLLLAHVVVGMKGYHDIGQPWLIGNPWPDISIHAVFSGLYGGVLLRSLANRYGT